MQNIDYICVIEYLIKKQNMEYEKFIHTKTKSVIDSGFDCNDFNPLLFPWQKTAVQIALKKGRKQSRE